MLALLALLTAAPALAQVALDARVDRSRIAEGETVSLTISISYAGRARPIFGRPEGGDFRVLGSTSFQTYSGGQAQVTQQYMLSPTRAGTLAVPAVTVTIGGTTYRTEPISVEVSSRSGTPPGLTPPATPPRVTIPLTPTPTPVNPTPLNPPANPVPVTPLAPGPQPPGLPQLPDRVDPSAPFLVVNPAREQVFVGEQFIVDYEVFEPLMYGWDLTGLRQPSFAGFWFEAVPVDTVVDYVPRQTTVAGVVFRSQLVGRFLVVPLDSGTRDLPPMTAEVSSLLGNRLEIESAPRTIEVMPLPPNAPPGFSHNNVGDYSFTVEVDPGGGHVGDPVRVTMRVEGMGLVSMVELPQLRVDGASVQPPVERGDQSLRGGAIRGYQQAETVVIPNREGDLTVGPFAFHYFEPRTARYQTIEHEAAVIPINGYGPNADLVVREVEEEEESLLDALAPPRGSAPSARWGGLPAPFFIGLAAFPPVAWVAVVMAGRWRQKRQQSRPERVRKGALGQARKQVRHARAQSPSQAYGTVASALREYLRDRFAVKAAALTTEGTSEALLERGLPREVATEVGRVLEECEVGRFGGAGEAEVQELARRAEKALMVLEGHA